jgi:Heterokaryon incompatibility protein (HET)
MADAVLSLRTSGDEGVWLDKLCINQSDEREKAVAIGAMDVVYRSARRLVILLEDVQLDAVEEKAAETYAGFYKDMEQLSIKNGVQGEAKTKFMYSNKYITGFNDELDMEVAQKLWEDARQFVKKLLNARWFQGLGAHMSVE